VIFVDRYEVCKIAKEADQIEDVKDKTILYSEDLY
jgi:hypothetical protein